MLAERSEKKEIRNSREHRVTEVVMHERRFYGEGGGAAGTKRRAQCGGGR